MTAKCENLQIVTTADCEWLDLSVKLIFGPIASNYILVGFSHNVYC